MNNALNHNLPQKNMNSIRVAKVNAIEVQAGYSPYISEDGTWWQYDKELRQFVDTFVNADVSKGVDYQQAINKPQINSVEIKGNLVGRDLKLVDEDSRVTNQEIYNMMKEEAIK